MSYRGQTGRRKLPSYSAPGWPWMVCCGYMRRGVMGIRQVRWQHDDIGHGHVSLESGRTPAFPPQPPTPLPSYSFVTSVCVSMVLWRWVRLWLECPGVRPNAEGESISPPHPACLLVKDRQAAQCPGQCPPSTPQGPAVPHQACRAGAGESVGV